MLQFLESYCTVSMFKHMFVTDKCKNHTIINGSMIAVTGKLPLRDQTLIYFPSSKTHTTSDKSAKGQSLTLNNTTCTSWNLQPASCQSVDICGLLKPTTYCIFPALQAATAATYWIELGKTRAIAPLNSKNQSLGSHCETTWKCHRSEVNPVYSNNTSNINKASKGRKGGWQYRTLNNTYVQ